MDELARERWQRVERLFDTLLELPESQREARLLESCDDADLREQVRDLLRRESREVGPLEDLQSALAQDDGTSDTLRGRILGGYRLIEPLGEGGMATVWRARREGGDFRREVALKCLKTGVYSPDLRARFLAEQAILARLEHPNIARMYDGGVAEVGSPYIVMELIEGLPITAHADAARLDLRQRVNLFLGVVDAVVHAHQELVIHRDLKPANILVDASGAPRLLDFGIACLLEPGALQAATTALRPLTPEYAAPEQLLGGPITLRTDVYALGLLLHELLCGLRAEGDAARRERSTPSSRLRRSDSPDALAAARRSSVARLQRQLRGDLDLIVLKCLREDPRQRYVSAEALGEDLRRWLERRPILAGQGSRRYRFKRFVQRHWLPLSAAAAVGLSLAAGLWLSWHEAQRADNEARLARQAQQLAEREAARADAVRNFVIGLFEADIAALPRDQMPSTRELVDRGIERARQPATGSAELRADMLLTLARILLARQQFETAAELLAEAEGLLGGAANAEPQTWARALLLRVDLLNGQRRYEELRAELDAALVYLQQRLPDEVPHLEMLRERALLELRTENSEAALDRLEALRLRVAQRSGLGSLPLRLSGDLAVAYGRLGRTADAERLHREVLVLKRASLETTPGSIASTLFNLGSAAASQGRLDEADALYREILTLLADIEQPMQVRAATWHGLAGTAQRRGDFDVALDQLESSATEWARVLDIDTVEDDFFIHYHRGRLLAEAGRSEQAIAATTRAIELMQAGQEAPAARIAASEAMVARLQCEGGEREAAEAWLARARRVLDTGESAPLREAEATCALARGLPEAALEWLGPEAADDPAQLASTGRSRRDLLRVRALLKSGRSAQAQALLRQVGTQLDALDLRPGHPLVVEWQRLQLRVNER
jgi:eukaryotic-like serine/threonine-protein kinase